MQFKKRKKSQERSKLLKKKKNIFNSNISRAELLLIYMAKTIHTFFPDLRQQMNNLPDDRKTYQYSMADIIFAAIAMFLLKCQSRNCVTEQRKKHGFSKAFFKIFNYNMPHMDTVDGIIKKIDPHHLEQICLCLVKTLIDRKTLHPFRLLSSYHVFSIDGVKIMSFSEPTNGTTKKVSKNGKESYTRSCVQVKITTVNGFSIPVMTEWISTEDGFSKQDCELNAFKRVTKRLKSFFPKLPICLVLDGLYANDTVFTICSTYKWAFSVTLKDASLKTLWFKIYDAILGVVYPLDDLLPASIDDGSHIFDDIEIPNLAKHSVDTLGRTLEWCNHLDYNGHTVHWFSCKEFTGDPESPCDLQYFAWLTNIKINQENVLQLEKSTRAGRSGIEDSFNTEKNRGYAMKHKYSRKSFTAARNYLTCMHIAEIIDQLVTLSLWYQQNLLEDAKSTHKELWADIRKELRFIFAERINFLSQMLPQNYCYK